MNDKKLYKKELDTAVLKLCKQSCFKTSIRLEPRASVPVLNVMFAIPVYSSCEQFTIGMQNPHAPVNALICIIGS
ncbi:hypothetical protein HMPREF9554_00131 [Treponema phagedenis F0421]|nr:hypothetical protein HMPREF9554_00131 [Treponema phagedenis F0421]